MESKKQNHSPEKPGEADNNKGNEEKTKNKQEDQSQEITGSKRDEEVDVDDQENLIDPGNEHRHN
jgi:hypothetical protein